ncbi:MAG: HlyD family efflux transporter periplasmic adaptor subunit, partial [Gammaproteobacteria bacterium]|nr:HlyD family efflux transporter periplasmic adaptor subunit [Gammaproteobacteria bacterium]
MQSFNLMSLKNALVVLILFLTASCAENKEGQPTETIENALNDTAMEHAAKHLDPKYVCPMHPQIIRDEPGSCPICGMDLVSKLIESNDDKYPAVEVQSAVIQNMGVRTTKAEIDTIWKYIRTVGRVDYDETTLTHLHPKTDGWMETLLIRAEGEPVKKGEKVGEFYSPEILSAQLDYLIALQQTGPQRASKAKNRLRLLGVAETTIEQIKKTGKSQNRVPVYAPAKGLVTMLAAREGMYLKPEMEFLTIADLSKVWVWVDIFEHQISWIEQGLTAEITVPAFPGKSWEGKVDYIYPELDPDSRTLRARLIFDNPDQLLKANMFAEVVIYGGPKRGILVVPTEAIIETGERTSIVKTLGKGRFQPVDVVVGIQRNGKSEILSGLKAG